MRRLTLIGLFALVVISADCSRDAWGQGGNTDPGVMSEVLGLLRELGYVPGSATTTIDKPTEYALTLFRRAENPIELSGKTGPYAENILLFRESLRSVLQRKRAQETQPTVFVATPHAEDNVLLAVDRLAHRAVSWDGTMIKSWDARTGRQRWSAVTPQVVSDRTLFERVAISADGSRAFVGYQGIRVYDNDTGHVLRTFWTRTEPNGRVATAYVLAARPGTNELIVAESGGPSGDRISIYDWNAGRHVGELGRENSVSVGLAVSPDGRYAASTSWEFGIRIWDLATRRLVRNIPGARGPRLENPVFLSDSRTVAAGAAYTSTDKSYLNTLYLFDVEKGTVSTQKFKTLGVYSAAADGRYLYVNGDHQAGGGYGLYLVDARGRIQRKVSGEASFDIRARRAGPADTLFSMKSGRVVAHPPDGRELWSVGEEKVGFRGFIREHAGISSLYGMGEDYFRFDTSTGSAERTGQIVKVGDQVHLLVGTFATADDRLIASYFDGGKVQVQTADDKPSCLIDAKGAPNSEVVVIGAYDHAPQTGRIAAWVGGEVVLFNDRDCRELRRFTVDFTSGTRALPIEFITEKIFPAGMRFSADGRTLFVWRAEAAVQAYDPETGRRVAVYSTAFDNGTIPAALAATFAAVQRNGLSPLVHHVLTIPNSNRFLAVISGNYMTRNAYKGGLVLMFEEGNPRWIAAYRLPQVMDKEAFDPSGSRVIADLLENGVQILEPATGRHLVGLGAQPGVIKALAFSKDGKLAFVLAGDGVLRTYDSNSGLLLLTTVVLSDGAWLSITPEGFFASSIGAQRIVHVKRGPDLFDIDQVYQSLYRPDLVREKLAGDTRGLVREAAARLDLTKVLASGNAPNVSLLSPRDGTRATAEQVSAEVEISERGGGIGRVEWRINGVTVGIETPPAPPAGQPLRLTRGLILDDGENEIEVVAYNGANLVASVPARASVTGQATATAGAPARMFVLAVGLNDYAEEKFKLAYAVPDAKALAKALTDAGKGVYESVEVTLVQDAEVQRGKLDAVFTDLATKVRPSDVFVFFLGGHGKTVDGRYYFIPQDFRIEGGVTKAALDAAVVKQGIAQEEWQAWLARIPARKSVLLFDTCESGSLTGEGKETRALERGAANDRLVQATGRTILTASSDDTDAFEGFRGHGLFTYNVLEALERADSDGNGRIEVAELAAYVYAQVTALSEQVYKQRQVPQVRITGNYSLAKPTQIFAGREPGIVLPGKATHQVSSAAELLVLPAMGARRVRKLDAKTPVTLVKSDAGWTLVAREGRPLGFVATKDLAPIQ